MNIEGKKKFTATITSLIVSVIGGLVTMGVIGEGAQETIVQLVSIIAPLALGMVYDLVQGMHDKAKEQVKLEKVKAENTSELNAPVLQYTYDKLIQPFDSQEFDEKVKKQTKLRYGVENPFTEFYTALALGKDREAITIEQVMDYWSYIYNKANVAFKAKFGFKYEDRNNKDNLKATIDNNVCTFPDIRTMAVQMGIDYVSILHEVEHVDTVRANLQKVKDLGLDWTKSNRTYYYAGEYAGELLKGS